MPRFIKFALFTAFILTLISCQRTPEPQSNDAIPYWYLNPPAKEGYNLVTGSGEDKLAALASALFEANKAISSKAISSKYKSPQRADSAGADSAVFTTATRAGVSLYFGSVHVEGLSMGFQKELPGKTYSDIFERTMQLTYSEPDRELIYKSYMEETDSAGQKDFRAYTSKTAHNANVADLLKALESFGCEIKFESAANLVFIQIQFADSLAQEMYTRSRAEEVFRELEEDTRKYEELKKAQEMP